MCCGCILKTQMLFFKHAQVEMVLKPPNLMLFCHEHANDSLQIVCTIFAFPPQHAGATKNDSTEKRLRARNLERVESGEDALAARQATGSSTM